MATLVGRRRIRVLQFAATYGGGLATHVATLAQRLNRDKYDVHVLCPDTGDLRRRLERLGIAADYVAIDPGMHPVADAKLFLRLVDYFRRHRFDVIHMHSTKAGFLGRLAASLCQVPIRLYTPNAYRFLRYRPGSVQWYAYLMIEWLGGRAGTGVIAAGASEGELTSTFRLAPTRGQFVVNNGVPQPENPVRRDPTLRRRLGLPEHRPLVLTIGRMMDQKAPLVFVEAAAAIARRVEAAAFVMVGDGELENAVRARAGELGITARLHIIPWTEEIPSLLLEADVFVMTSRYEGLSYAAAEAAGTGLPLVVSDVPGLRDLVLDGETGFVFAPGDAVGCADRVIRLLEDVQLRANLGTAAARLVAKCFNVGTMIEETERVYDALVSKRLPR